MCCGCHECSEEKIRPCLPYSAPPYFLPQLTVGWISGIWIFQMRDAKLILDVKTKREGEVQRSQKGQRSPVQTTVLP